MAEVWRVRPGSAPFRLAAAVVVAVAVTGLLWAGLVGHVFQGFRLAALDALFPSGPVDDRVLVVEIDAASIEGPGWPWPREQHAALIRALAAGGPAAIAYDVVFPDLRPGDDELAAALAAAGNVVLAASADVRPVAADDLFEVVPPRVEPHGDLADAAAAVAHVSVLADPLDGVVRSLPLVVEVERRFRPALSVAAVALLDGADPRVVTVRPGGVEVGDRYHPSPDGLHRTVTLGYAAGLGDTDPGRPAATASEVLAGRVGPDVLAGRLVLVGVTDRLLGDRLLTPVAKTGGMPGVYVHANAVNTMLTGRYHGQLDDEATLAAVAVLALLVCLAALWLPLWAAPLVALAAAAGWFVLADLRFEQGTASDLVYPNLAIAAAAVGAVAVRYLTELREKRRVAGLFSQYVPDAVADELIASGRVRAATEGERVEITVFFCDLRGFTATAATLQPSEVRDLLNVYYEHATTTVFDHGGTVMQYVGDEVFAVFGAPVPMADHAQRALDCARTLQDLAADLNAELARRGVPPIAFGIGLNTGEVVAAHVGSSVHRQYAVVGDTVNVGSRLCSLARAGQIVISGAVRARLAAEPPLEPLGPVPLKGVSEDPHAYRVELEKG